MTQSNNNRDKRKRVGLISGEPRRAWDLPLVDERSVPTSKGFGRPIALSQRLYTVEKTKTLLCKATEDTCLVGNMPLLKQDDEEVKAALVAFVKSHASNGKIDYGGTTWTVDDLVRSMMRNGCYTTSQITVGAASLANRAPDVPLSAQAKEIAGIAGGGNLSKAQRQLLWAYKNHFLNKFDKKTRHFNFPGVVADVGGGIEQTCDPFAYDGCSGQKVTATNKAGDALWQKTPLPAELTNDKLKALMLNDRVILLAYCRLKPSPSYDKNTGILTVNFTVDSQHKVVVSGFQPGLFPLLINDVGSGQRVRARLSSDLGSLKFSSEKGIKTVKYTFADAKWQNRPFLVYEGEDEKIAPLVFFLAHYDYLWIRTSPINPECKKIRDQIKALDAQIKQIKSSPGYIQGPGDPRPGKPDPADLAEIKELQAKRAGLMAKAKALGCPPS